MEDGLLLDQNGFPYEEENFAEPDLDDLFGPDNNDDGHNDNQILSELSREMGTDENNSFEALGPAQGAPEANPDEADDEFNSLLMNAAMPNQDG